MHDDAVTPSIRSYLRRYSKLSSKQRTGISLDLVLAAAHVRLTAGI